MLGKYSVKIIISFFSLSVLTIGFLVFWLSFDLPKTKRVLADLPIINGTWIPLRGYAWVGSPNACGGATEPACGANPSPSWISFNCRNDNTCYNSATNAGHDYWVAVNKDTGELNGYAWSDNVGWIDVNPADIDIMSAGLETTCSSGCDTNSCSACYNQTERKFHGWARILSEADNVSAYDNGWISLDNIIISGTDYGLSVINENDSRVSGDPKGGVPWGDLSGWAWNGANANIGSNSTSGIGWVSFNCNNNGAGGCASSYRVTGRPEDLGVLKIERIKGNESYGLNINWSTGYPAYGATSYEVWRQNGQCYENGQPITPNEDCDAHAYCSRGTCNLSLPYDTKWTVASGSSYDNEPLNLFVTYNYTVRACNIFGCSKTSSRPLKTSPIEHVRNFKATPICATPETAQTSYVDMTWNKPYVVSFSGAVLTEYDLEYCQLDVTGDISKCATWTPAVADCASPITFANINTQSPYNCREKLTGTRAQSKDFYVYRVRGVADRGTCLGGDNDGKECPLNNCAPGGGTCDSYKSTWAFSNTFRVCPVGTSYQEQRPQ